MTISGCSFVARSSSSVISATELIDVNYRPEPLDAYGSAWIVGLNNIPPTPPYGTFVRPSGQLTIQSMGTPWDIGNVIIYSCQMGWQRLTPWV